MGSGGYNFFSSYVKGVLWIVLPWKRAMMSYLEEVVYNFPFPSLLHCRPTININHWIIIFLNKLHWKKLATKGVNEIK